jgi:hypothetical protein
MNMAPNFIEPLENIEIIPDNPSIFSYHSPKIYDAESDEIKIKVKVKKIKDFKKEEVENIF